MDRKVCGIYYYKFPFGHAQYYHQEPTYLPLLNLTTEITLYPTFSKTVLRQHFKNPSTSEPIPEANYTFPLHTTQTITSFTCHVGEDKTLNGIVQSKPKAKATYDAAVARGETAGLLSWSASDVWQTKLGNIPAGDSVEVVLTCIAQLQHDSEKDALRFNLPTYIAPRYGVPPKDVYESAACSFKLSPKGPGWWHICRGTRWVDIEAGMKISVFVEMDSPLQMVEAPAHPASLKMGTNSLGDSNSADFDPRKAVLTLAAETTALDKDFVVLVKTAKMGFPTAVLQRHPTKKDTAGMMLTLVPKFNLPVARPEVVFIVDRSGSMSGNEKQLRKALAVFLQSLPVGCKFNICSFGSSHKFLWKKSKSYTEETLREAQQHVSKFEADMGGTEMYGPVKDSVERRYKDLNLELLLLTDGDIWQRDQLMDYVREQCKAKTVRMFTLGIGNGISHGLIDGLASVGGGYSQVVQLDEKLDSKVVRMLRAALGQHVSDYTLEFPDTSASGNEDDDYDMLTDTETLRGDAESIKESTKNEESEVPKKKILLFDTDADLDAPMKTGSDDSDEARWSHLPKLPVLPAKIQSPHVIPPLFPFSRTNVYVVFSPVPKVLPKKAKLHAKTLAGDDLELEIPILKIEDGKDVLQLAARSFLQELEDGKGYLHEGVLADAGLSKTKQESMWDEITEREGVRWGEGFGVASKWTSFVAIEDKKAKDVQPEPEAEPEMSLSQREGAGGGGMFGSSMPAPRAAVSGMMRCRKVASPSTNAAPAPSATTSEFAKGEQAQTNIFDSSGFQATSCSAAEPVVALDLLEDDLVLEDDLELSMDIDDGLTIEYDRAAEIPVEEFLEMDDFDSDSRPNRSVSPRFSPTSPAYSPASPRDSPIHPGGPMSPRFSPTSPAYASCSPQRASANSTDPVSPSYSPEPSSESSEDVSMHSSPSLIHSGDGGSEVPRKRHFEEDRELESGVAAISDESVSRKLKMSSGPPQAVPPPPPPAASACVSAMPPAAAMAPAPLPAPKVSLPIEKSRRSDLRQSSNFKKVPGAFGVAECFEADESDGSFDLDLTHMSQVGNTSADKYAYASEEEDDEDEIDDGSSEAFAKLSTNTRTKLSAYSPALDQTIQKFSSPDTSKKSKGGALSSIGNFFSRSRSSPRPQVEASASSVSYERAEAKEEASKAKKRSIEIKTTSPDERIHSLIMLQTFAGNFTLSDKLAKVIEASFKDKSSGLQKKLAELAQKLGVSEEVIATLAAILSFEKGEGHSSERDTWELVVEKAGMWIDDQGVDSSIKAQVGTAIGA